MTRIAIYDTTLRDGSQGEGVNFSLQDKLLITARLDELGIDYIEGGYPLSNPKDAAYFRAVRELSLTHAKVAAFGMTRRKDDRRRGRPGHEGPGRRRDAGRHHRRQDLGPARPRRPRRLARREPADDRRLGRLLRGARAGGDLRRRALLRRLQAQPRLRPADPPRRRRRRGRLDRPLRHQRRLAARAGRRGRRRRSPARSRSRSASTPTTTATWPSPTPWPPSGTGPRQVQGTINGIGERCGNVDLCSVIANLALKYPGYEVLLPGKLDPPHRGLALRLRDGQHELPRRTSRSSAPAPSPTRGGCTSTASARTPPATSTSTPRPSATSAGCWSASFRASRTSPRSWPSTASSRTPRSWRRCSTACRTWRTRATSSRPPRRRSSCWWTGWPAATSRGSSASASTSASRARPIAQSLTEATVKLRVGDAVEHTVSEGDGPVNALDGALRKALERHYPAARGDAPGRLQGARHQRPGRHRRAGPRRDRERRDHDSVWGTVGVSENVIEASWLALVDAFEYKLSKDARSKAPARTVAGGGPGLSRSVRRTIPET